MYFYDNTDDTFHQTKPILDDLTPIPFYRGEGVLATKMCFVLEYSSQGANDVKENRPLLVCILTRLINCLGCFWFYFFVFFLGGGLRQQVADYSCRFHLRSRRQERKQRCSITTISEGNMLGVFFFLSFFSFLSQMTKI